MVAVAPVFEPQEFTLSNGLRLVIVPTGVAPVATLMVLYQVAEKAMPLVSIWRAFFAIIGAGFLDILR